MGEGDLSLYQVRWPTICQIAICVVDSPLKWVSHQSNLKSGIYVTKKKERNLSDLVFLFIFLLLSSSLLGFQRCLHHPQYSGKHFISSYILLYLCIYHVSLLFIKKKCPHYHQKHTTWRLYVYYKLSDPLNFTHEFFPFLYTY